MPGKELIFNKSNVYFSTLKYFNLWQYLKYLEVLEETENSIRMVVMPTCLPEKVVEIYNVMENHRSREGVFPIDWIQGACLNRGQDMQNTFLQENIIMKLQGIITNDDLNAIMVLLQNTNIIQFIQIGSFEVAIGLISNFEAMNPGFKDVVWFDLTRRNHYISLMAEFLSKLVKA